MIDAVKELGGSVKIVYHTPTTLTRVLKAHKFWKTDIKTPMPPPYKVLKMEAMRDKGCLVDYGISRREAILGDAQAAAARIAETRTYLKVEHVTADAPMDRSEGVSHHVPRREPQEIQGDHRNFSPGK